MDYVRGWGENGRKLREERMKVAEGELKKIKIKCGWKRMKRREKEGQEKSRRAIECLNEDRIK